MTDRVSPQERSRIMAKVKGKDTTPELTVRRLLHALGYRFRLHRKDLPGRPDLTFPSRGKVIFVHGCFWHRHTCRQGRSMPQANREYWEAKFARNKQRDKRVRGELRELGWEYLCVWECWIKDEARLIERLTRFLDDESA